jgi:5-methylthioribose kinase
MDFYSFLNSCPFLEPPFTCKPLSGGNMNEVILVKDSQNKEIICKYAPPYLHMLGPSFPLGQERISIEAHALQYFHLIAPNFIPKVLHVNESKHTIVLEYKKGFSLLRDRHILGEFNPKIYKKIGEFLAKLYLNRPKNCAKKYYENPTLKSITNEYVFSIAFIKNSPKTMPHPWFKPLKKSKLLLKNLSSLKELFNTPQPYLIHGDLHTGSILIKNDQIAIIDAEFALFGPISFDIGNVFAHTIMDSYLRDFPLKSALKIFWESFVYNIKKQDDLDEIFSQSVGFCGVEIARRLVVPAKSISLELLEDKKEAYKKMDQFSCYLIENFKHITTLQDLLDGLK